MDDEVIINFIANAVEAIAEMDKLIAIEEEIVAVTEAAKAALDDFRDSVPGLNAVAWAISRINQQLIEATETAYTASRAGKEAMDDYRNAALEAEAAIASAEEEIDRMSAAIAGSDVTAESAARALRDMGYSALFAAAAEKAVDESTGAANRQMMVGIGWWRMTATALHWVISGTLELLAVLIPATIAAAAWAAVWAQGAQSVAEHMTAVYDATEAMGRVYNTTAGQVIGLGNALQKAQDAAMPAVWQALGGAIQVVKERAGGLAQVGTDVGNVFDDFMAKMVVDFQKGSMFSTDLDRTLHAMVPDLVEIGQVFGNLGHIIANLAGAMPGLAEVLLGIIDGVTRFLAILSNAPAIIFTVLIGLEEFMRWGGLLVKMLGAIGIAMDVDMGDKFLSAQRFVGVFMNLFMALPNVILRGVMALGQLVSTLGPVGGKFNNAGQDISNFANDLLQGMKSINIWQAALIIAAAVGLGIFIDKLITAQTATQQFIATIQKAVAGASTLQAFDVMTQGIVKLQDAAAATSDTIAGLGQRMDAYSHASNGAAVGTLNTAKAMHEAHLEEMQQQANLQQLTAAQEQLEQQYATTAGHVVSLANTYKTNLVGAMELASMANVKLQNATTKTAWAMDQIKIADLVAGMQAMATGSSALGRDITVMGIASALAATKVSQLNQAWDQFMQNLTGGTSALSNFEQGMENMGSVTATVTNNLSNATGSISLNASQFANALKSSTGIGASAWQNFDQVVGSTAPQLADWLRIAGTEGAISGQQMSQAAKDVVAQMVPLAEKSAAAKAELLGLAQNMGLNVSTWPELLADLKDGHESTANLASIIDQATVKMGNMAQVAQQLGSALNQDIVGAMNAALFKTSGVSQAMLTYTQDLRQNIGQTAAGEAARSQLIHDLELAGESAANAKKLVQLLQQEINAMHGNTVDLRYNYIVTGSPPTVGNPSGVQVIDPGHWGGGAAGGLIIGRGTGTSDSNIAAVSHGEFIMQAAAVQRYGTAFMAAVNAQKFANGGLVGPGGVTGFGGSPMQVNIHIDSYLDGSKVNSSTRTQTLIYNRRNVSNNLSLRVR